MQRNHIRCCPEIGRISDKRPSFGRNPDIIACCAASEQARSVAAMMVCAMLDEGEHRMCVRTWMPIAIALLGL
jgi:hypothetical protein